MGLAGSLLLAVGGGAGLAFRSGRKDAPAPEGLMVVSADNWPLLLSVVEAVIPKPEAAHEVAVAVDSSLSFAPPRVGRDLNLVFGLLENGLVGAFTRGSTTPFSLLSIEERQAGLLKWRDKGGTLGGAYTALRKLPSAAFYVDENEMKEVGYPGPIFEKPDPGPVPERGPLSPPFVMTPQPPPEPAPGDKDNATAADGGPDAH